MQLSQAIEVARFPAEYGESQEHEAYQYLIETGNINNMEPRFKSRAMELIDQGYCRPAGNPINNPHGASEGNGGGFGFFHEMAPSQIDSYASQFARDHKIAKRNVEVAELSDRWILTAGDKMRVVKKA